LRNSVEKASSRSAKPSFFYKNGKKYKKYCVPKQPNQSLNAYSNVPKTTSSNPFMHPCSSQQDCQLENKVFIIKHVSDRSTLNLKSSWKNISSKSRGKLVFVGIRKAPVWVNLNLSKRFPQNYPLLNRCN